MVVTDWCLQRDEMNALNWEIVSKIADIVTIIGFPFALLALAWTYLQLRWMFRQISEIEAENQLSKDRDILKQAVIIPSPRIRSYSNVYSDLTKLYTQKLGNDSLPVNAAYFDHTIGSFFKSGVRFSGAGKDANQFSFPLAGKREWLLSQNRRFEIRGKLQS